MKGPMSVRVLLWAFLLGAGAFGVSVRAQHAGPLAQPTFRTETNLVEVVAVVTGEDDRSLGDLAAADFEVLEDGTVRTLVSVRRLTADARETAVATAASAGAPAYVERLPTTAGSADAPAFVLLLDDLDTSPRNSHRVIRTGERALSYIPDSALVAVVTTSGLNGSLLTLEPPNPSHVKQVRDFRGQLLLRPATFGGTTPSSVNAPCGVGSGFKDSLDCADPTRPARRAAAVAAAAEILGRAGARRKVLLWVAQTMGVSTLDPEGSRRAQRRALASALKNDVTVFVLDPRENYGIDEPDDEKRVGGTLRAGAADTRFSGGGAMTMALDVDDMVAVPLTQLTRETGGRYITMANNLGDLMGRIIEQNSTSYLLVYESPVSRTPGRHRIDVRVKRAGARVSARQGYIVEPPASDTASPPPSDDSLLRRTLLGSAPQGQLQLTVHAVPRFASGRSGAVSVTVLADDAEGGITSPLDLVLATFDDEGRVTNQHQVRLEPPPAGTPLELTTELPLGRGHHQLRVAAVTADAAKTGLVITPVEIVEPGRQLLMASPIVLQRVGEQVTPTAARHFPSGALLGVQAEVAGRPVKEGKVAVKMSLADSSGAVVRTVDATLNAGDSSDRQRATGLLDTTGLGGGPYLLAVEAAMAGSSTPVRHVIPIRLDPTRETTSALRHSVVAHGPSSRHAGAATFVIRTDEEWRAFWSQLPTRQHPPPIDFSRATLFAIVGGGAETPSDKPVVVSVNAADGETVVVWRTEPDTAAASKSPFTVVACRNIVSNQVRFERQQ